MEVEFSIFVLLVQNCSASFHSYSAFSAPYSSSLLFFLDIYSHLHFQLSSYFLYKAILFCLDFNRFDSWFAIFFLRFSSICLFSSYYLFWRVARLSFICCCFTMSWVALPICSDWETRYQHNNIWTFENSDFFRPDSAAPWSWDRFSLANFLFVLPSLILLAISIHNKWHTLQ